VVDADPAAAEADVRLYLGGSVLGAIWLQRGQLPLHASALALPGGGCVAFTGAMGAGKSSVAAHLAYAGYPLVTDDIAVLAERDGGLAIWRGPARVKLAADVLESLEQDVAGLPSAGGTRGKFDLAVPAVATADEVPIALRAIIVLSWADGAPRVETLKGLDAIDAIGGHTYRQEFVRPLGMEATWLRHVVQAARIVPTMRLSRPRGHHCTVALLEAAMAAAQNDGEMKAAT
jgi:hypothetical protein